MRKFSSLNKILVTQILVLGSASFLWAQEAPKPFGAVPTERQLRWHEMEMYCLIHYTPTTFQDKEWGFGDADPAIFNPSHFDAHQIARAAASAGFRGLISVAKHHDGFCLWPTKTTTYSIARSPWKNGKGDMVREFMEASRENGLKFGVYLSAWDRNDTRYGTPAYAEAYREQLTELMSNYGELFTSWHDGANGGDGYYGGRKEKRIIDRTTYYEWEEKTWPIVRKLQPMACIFSDVGPDMRWVGNEKGYAAETSWATITPIGLNGAKPVPGAVEEHNLPTGDRFGRFWIPAECDVPLRDGWFYHKNQDLRVKTPEQLFEIYLKSVGRGANMNLGLAPMPEGILHPNDVKALQYFGRKLRKTFETNLAKEAVATSTSLRGNSAAFAPANIFDGDRYSYYAPEDGVFTPEIEVTLDGEKEFDIIRLRENIKLGQRMDSVQVWIWKNQQWQHVASATSIGANRLIKLSEPIKTSKLKICLFAPVEPTLSDFALFKEFKEPFFFDSPAMENNERQSYSFVNKEKTKKDIERSLFVIKGNEMVFKLDGSVTKMVYEPRQDGRKEGIVIKYAIYSSDDGKTWSSVTRGEFSNILANPVQQIVEFGKTIDAKFIKVVALENSEITFKDLAFYK